MKVAVIKSLSESHPLNTLQEEMSKLENGDSLSIEVGGDDEGEQLTHLLGAIWILEQMQINGTDLRTELRNFSSRVRESIS